MLEIYFHVFRGSTPSELVESLKTKQHSKGMTTDKLKSAIVSSQAKVNEHFHKLYSS